MITPEVIHAITSLPANDGNFESSIKGASVEEIKNAIDIMENRDAHDKGRISACKRELRKRGIKNVN